MAPSTIWTKHTRRLPGAAVLGLCLAWPGIAAAEEPTLDEVAYHPSELPPDAARGRVLLVGVALTAGWYGASVGTSYLWADAPNAKDLRLPVVGPWLALADAGCGDDESGCSTFTVVARSALAIVSGVGQLGGLFAIGEGIFMSTGSPAAATKSGAPLRPREPAVAAVPVVLPNGAGVEFVGRF